MTAFKAVAWAAHRYLADATPDELGFVDDDESGGCHYDVFETNHADTPMELRRDDCSGIHADDDAAAVAFVRDLERGGNWARQVALRLLFGNPPAVEDLYPGAPEPLGGRAMMTRATALQILDSIGIPVGADFHALDRSKVDGLLQHARQAKYRRPKNAAGSVARYFHAYLQRRAADRPYEGWR